MAGKKQLPLHDETHHTESDDKGFVFSEEPETKGSWRYDPERPNILVPTCDNPDCGFCLDAIDDETGKVLNPPDQRWYAEWASPILASDTQQYTCSGCGKVF